MKFEDIAEQLNNVYGTLFSEYESGNFRTKFFGGDYREKLKQIIFKEAPNSQIAFVGIKETYLKRIKELTEAVSVLGGTIAGLILEPQKLSVDSVSEIFNLPDDVRLAVTFDAELFERLSYYCNFKEIPLVLIPKNSVVHNIMESEIAVKNGKKIDKINVSVKRYIILDSKLMNETSTAIASTYAEIMSNLTAFTDYRIYGAATGEKVYKAAYNLARSAVYEEFEIFNKKPEDRLILTVKNGIFIEMAALITKGIFINSSVPQVYARFADTTEYGYLAALKLSVAFETLYLYDALLEYGFFNALPILNYNERAEKVAEFLGISEEPVIDALLYQIKVIEPNLKKAEETLLKLKDEISALNKLKKGILSVYTALGGETYSEVYDKKEIFSKLKFAGDTLFGINGMSVLRDSGLLEYGI